MGFAPKHILAAVAVGQNDDVTLAEQLVDAACDLVERAGADGRLSIVYAAPSDTPALAVDTGSAPPAYYAALAQMLEAQRADSAKKLVALGERAHARGVHVSTQMLAPGESVGEAIAHDAASRAADLVVLWSHNKRGLRRLFLGSVAERVAHLARMPVLILRAP